MRDNLVFSWEERGVLRVYSELKKFAVDLFLCDMEHSVDDEGTGKGGCLCIKFQSRMTFLTRNETLEKTLSRL